MKSLYEYMFPNNNILEAWDKDRLLKRLEFLRKENERLGDESDELAWQYGCDDTTGEDEYNDELFFANAPDDVLAQNSEIWDKIRKNDEEMSRIYKALAKIKEKEDK